MFIIQKKDVGYSIDINGKKIGFTGWTFHGDRIFLVDGSERIVDLPYNSVAILY